MSATFPLPAFALAVRPPRDITFFASLEDLAATLVKAAAPDVAIVPSCDQLSIAPCGSTEVLAIYGNGDRSRFLGYACGLGHDFGPLRLAVEQVRAELLTEAAA